MKVLVLACASILLSSVMCQSAMGQTVTINSIDRVDLAETEAGVGRPNAPPPDKDTNRKPPTDVGHDAGAVTATCYSTNYPTSDQRAYAKATATTNVSLTETSCNVEQKVTVKCGGAGAEWSEGISEAESYASTVYKVVGNHVRWRVHTKCTFTLPNMHGYTFQPDDYNTLVIAQCGEYNELRLEWDHIHKKWRVKGSMMKPTMDGAIAVDDLWNDGEPKDPKFPVTVSYDFYTRVYNGYTYDAKVAQNWGILVPPTFHRIYTTDPPTVTHTVKGGVELKRIAVIDY